MRTKKILSKNRSCLENQKTKMGKDDRNENNSRTER